MTLPSGLATDGEIRWSRELLLLFPRAGVQTRDQARVELRPAHDH